MLRNQKLEALRLIANGVPADKAVELAELPPVIVFHIPEEKERAEAVNRMLSENGIERLIINLIDRSDPAHR